MDNTLDMASTAVGSFTVITVEGVLDATTRERFADGLAAVPGDLLLELSGVTFMDSRALGLIAHRWQSSLTDGSRFGLVGVRYSTAKVMWITGLVERLPLYDTLQEALASA